MGSPTEIERLRKRLERERGIRAKSEELGENATRALYDEQLKLREANETLSKLNVDLENALTHAMLLATEADAANQAKNDFTAKMSHELRTPLNAIIGFNNVLMNNEAGHLSEQEITYLQRVRANSEQLLSLVNGVLDLAKVEAGAIELTLEPCNLQQLIDETCLETESMAMQKGVALMTEVPEGLSTLRTDRARLKQVLINLIGNAIKFTETGSITVAVTMWVGTGQPRRIDVSDTGVGIPADQLKSIFEPFRQVDTGDDRSPGGTGLGLSISKSLCELMEIELGVESEEGVGTTFSLSMP